MSSSAALPSLAYPFNLVDTATGVSYTLKAETVIGRTAGDILLSDDRRVSSRHCRLLMAATGPLIEDLKSSNGTLVNGAKLTPGQAMSLAPGARITIGDHVFEFALVGAPANAPSTETTGPAAPSPLATAGIATAPGRKKRDPTTLLAILFFAAAGAALFAGLKPRAKSAAPKTPATIAATPTTIDLYLRTSSEEFDRLAKSYARLIDGVSFDEIDKRAAIEEMKAGLEPLARRLLEETRTVKPTTDSDRLYIDLHQRMLFALHQQMVATMSFWKTGDDAAGKEAARRLTEYLEAARQMQEFLEHR